MAPGNPPLADVVEVLLAPLWTVLVAFIALFLLWLFRAPLRRLAIELGISKVKLLGMELDPEALAEETKRAYEDREVEPPTAHVLRSLAALAARLAPLARGKRILWVDDQPHGNVEEVRVFRQLGVDVENALTTAEAVGRLEKDPARFDLVVSDWKREDADDAGPGLLMQLQTSEHRHRPFIFYVGEVTPKRLEKAAELGAVVFTADPAELLKHSLVELAAQS